MSTSHKRDIVCKGGRNRAKRAKTFASEENAKKHAAEKGIKKFKIEKAKKGKRFKVVEE